MSEFPVWLDAVREAYRIAFTERRNELDATRVRRFDERGLCPYSILVGEIRTLERQAGIEGFDPVLMRREAHRDAELAFRKDLLREVKTP